MPLDSLGRQIDSVNAASLLGPVGPKNMTVRSEETDESKFAKKIMDALAEFSEMFVPISAALKQFTSKVANQHTSLQEMKRERGGRRSSWKDGLDEKSMSRLFEKQQDSFADNFDLLDKLAKAGLKKGSMYTHDTHSERLSRKIVNQQSVMIQLLVHMSKSMSKMANDTTSPTVQVESLDEHGNASMVGRSLEDLLTDSTLEQHSSTRRRQNIQRRQLFERNDPFVQIQRMYDQFSLDPIRTVHLRTQDLASGIMQRGESNPMTKGLFGGAGSITQSLEKSNQYQQNIAEVAYATQGITLETAKQQSLFRANNDLNNIAVASGQDKEKIEEQYLKSLKQGYKTQKDTLKLTKTSAHLSTMLGSNFEQTSEFANELHMALGLTSDSVGEIARGMRSTARSSKISGDAMIAAAQSAKPFLESMRNAGNLTANTAKNMIAIQASMQKFGVAGNFQDLFQGMTGPNSVMNSAFENQALMSIMGGNQGLMPFLNGQMAGDPQKLMEGWKNLSDYVANVSGKSLADMTKMSEEEFSDFVNQNWQINLAIKGQVGKEMGELRKGFQAIEESSKTFDVRMMEINKQLSSAATTDEERVKLMTQQTDLMQEQRGNIAARAASAFEGVATLEEGLAKLKGNRQTMNDLANAAKGGLFGSGFKAESLLEDNGLKEALRKSFVDSAKASSDVLSKSADLLDDRFIIKNAGGRFDEALKTGNIQELAKLEKQLGEAQSAAESSTMAETDPARSAAKGINSLNSAFATYASGALMYLKLIAGADLIQGVGLASLITRVISATGIQPEDFAAAFSRFDKVFGNGKLATVLKGIGTGLKEGLRIDVGGTFLKDKIKSAGSRLSGIGSRVGGRGLDLLDDVAGIDSRNIAGSIGRGGKGLFGKGKAAFSRGGKFFGDVASRGVGENIARFAQFQEKIPVWGKFAKMFGAGNNVTSATTRIAAANPAYGFTSNTAKLAGMSGTKSLATIATKAALPLTLLTTALESMSQALKTGERSAEIFEVALSDVTNAQRAAAENAGMLTGILNALTFGIFSHWIGSTGAVTDALARFLNKFQLLNVALSVLAIPLKAVYGVFWGLIGALGEIFKGIWDGIKLILQPFGEVLIVIWDGLTELWNVLADVVSPLKAVFGEFGEGISLIDALIGTLKMLGTVVGWVFRIVGGLISLPLRGLVLGLKVVIGAIVLLTKAIAAVIKPLVAFGSTIAGDVIDFFGILWKAISAFFTLDIKKFGSAIGDMFKLVARNVPIILLSAFTTLASSVGTVFYDLAAYIGRAVVDVISQIAQLPLIKKALNAPGVAMGALGTALGPAGTAIGAAGAAIDWTKKKLFGFASGGAITESGLAMIHNDELIVPKDHANDILTAKGNPIDFSGKGGFGEINARPLTDIQTQVEQEYAGNRPASATVSSGELSMIATLTQNQLSIMTEQLSELREIRSYLSPNTGGSTKAAPSSRSNTKPSNSPNYHTLSFGGYGGNASKGIVNDGVT